MLSLTTLCRSVTFRHESIVSGGIEVHAWRMAELTKNGVRVKIEIWVDHRKIAFGNVDSDFGSKGLIGSFIPGSAAERQAREPLIRHGKLPTSV
jgi:hypothetical protein